MIINPGYSYHRGTLQHIFLTLKIHFKTFLTLKTAQPECNSQFVYIFHVHKMYYGLQETDS